jgi:hypothetical protein
MTVPHYPYLVVKMPAPNGVLSVRADFLAASDCMHEAIQAAVDQSGLAAQKKLKVDAEQMSQEELKILTNEASSSGAIQATVPTKSICLDTSDATKMTEVNATLPPK